MVIKPKTHKPNIHRHRLLYPVVEHTLAVVEVEVDSVPAVDHRSHLDKIAGVVEDIPEYQISTKSSPKLGNSRLFDAYLRRVITLSTVLLLLLALIITTLLRVPALLPLVVIFLVTHSILSKHPLTVGENGFVSL